MYLYDKTQYILQDFFDYFSIFNKKYLHYDIQYIYPEIFVGEFRFCSKNFWFN